MNKVLVGLTGIPCHQCTGVGQLKFIQPSSHHPQQLTVKSSHQELTRLLRKNTLDIHAVNTKGFTVFYLLFPRLIHSTTTETNSPWNFSAVPQGWRRSSLAWKVLAGTSDARWSGTSPPPACEALLCTHKLCRTTKMAASAPCALGAEGSLAQWSLHRHHWKSSIKRTLTLANHLGHTYFKKKKHFWSLHTSLSEVTFLHWVLSIIF